MRDCFENAKTLMLDQVSPTSTVQDSLFDILNSKYFGLGLASELQIYPSQPEILSSLFNRKRETRIPKRPLILWQIGSPYKTATVAKSNQIIGLTGQPHESAAKMSQNRRASGCFSSCHAILQSYCSVRFTIIIFLIPNWHETCNCLY
jgi:hypothetical protein